jgi:hypothetical protein
LPQSIAFCSSVSPGRETCDRAASFLRAAIFAASWPSGSCSAAESSLCASASPLSEPATATHNVFEPPAGTVTS